eukprot:441488-Pelagomonas_calceolata.AAC.2
MCHQKAQEADCRDAHTRPKQKPKQLRPHRWPHHELRNSSSYLHFQACMREASPKEERPPSACKFAKVCVCHTVNWKSLRSVTKPQALQALYMLSCYLALS